MIREIRDDRNTGGMQPRCQGARSAGVRKHYAQYEFPSLWESMEEDVSDQFDDWWLRT
jgi:hypothetical protein